MRPESMTNRLSTGAPFAERALAHFQPPDGPVRGQPLELLSGRGSERPVIRQPIDEIGFSHRSATRVRILHPSPELRSGSRGARLLPRLLRETSRAANH